MKRLQLLLCLGLTGLLPASAQDGSAPIHPVIVSRLVLTNQTQPLGSPTSPNRCIYSQSRRGLSH